MAQQRHQGIYYLLRVRHRMRREAQESAHPVLLRNILHISLGTLSFAHHTIIVEILYNNYGESDQILFTLFVR